LKTNLLSIINLGGDNVIVVECGCGKKQVLHDYRITMDDCVTFREYSGKCKCGEKLSMTDVNLKDLEKSRYLN